MGTVPHHSCLTRPRVLASGRSRLLPLQGSVRRMLPSQILRDLNVLMVKLLDLTASPLPIPPSPTLLLAENTLFVSSPPHPESSAVPTAWCLTTLITSAHSLKMVQRTANVGTPAQKTHSAQTAATQTAAAPRGSGAQPIL